MRVCKGFYTILCDFVPEKFTEKSSNVIEMRAGMWYNIIALL